MDTCYRLYIGRNRKGADPVSHDAVVLWASTQFEGATIFEASGLWRGVCEPTTVIEAFQDAADRPVIAHIAEEARAAFGQESVLLAILPASARLVTS